jgi:cell division protease FtsH
MSSNRPESGLAWPDHDRGPTLPPEYEGRERDEERKTRKPLGWWDRFKFLFLLLGGFAALVWGTMANDPILPFGDALTQTIRSGAWVLVLAWLEALRQAHFFISEHWARYHRFWAERIFGGLNRRAGKMNDWNRFRIARAVKWLFWLAIFDLILAKLIHEPPAIALFKLPVIIFQALPMIVQAVVIISLGLLQIVALYWFLSKGGIDVYFPDDIKTRFRDVWGQDHVLNRIKENMVFLDDPESIEEKGGYVPGGILLWGPPGTGKTLMAEAVAGETGKPFVFVDPGAFIQMFMGVGILKVKSLFRKLRKLAVRYGGVIVFFDEADSLGNRGMQQQGGPFGGYATPAPWSDNPSCSGLKYLNADTVSLLMRTTLSPSNEVDQPGRSINRFIMGMGGGGGMGTLQALLTEMSGLKKPRGFFNRKIRRALGMRPKPPPKYRILHMFATNMPQALDEAMLRPGRIDRIYKVGYPSKEGRKRTYQGYLDKVKHGLNEDEVEKLATITPYATGATIKDLVNEALIHAIREGRDVITWRDVMKAKQLKDLGPPEDVEYIERERHAVAVHEACHAVVAYRARYHLNIDIATIEKGGTYLGMVASIKPEDQFTHWRSEYEADIMTSLASLAGERKFFEEDSSSGVSSDLESATMIATLMEGYWGMGHTVASHGVTHQVGIAGGGKPGKEKDKKEHDLLDKNLGSRIEANLGELLERTHRLLDEHRLEVLAVAHALESHKTLAGDDVEAILDGRPGPLVDGRPYHTPEFAQMLEAYHTEAAAAHKSHSALKVALPALPKVEDDTSGDGHPDDGEGIGAEASGNGEVKTEEPSSNGPSKRVSEPPVEVGVGEAPEPEPDEKDR